MESADTEIVLNEHVVASIDAKSRIPRLRASN